MLSHNFQRNHNHEVFAFAALCVLLKLFNHSFTIYWNLVSASFTERKNFEHDTHVLIMLLMP